MTKYEHAIALAKQGFHVFPIVEGKKSPPRMAGWQRFATRDIHKIQAMWHSHPNDNIGISTSKFGDRGALLVVDVDNKGDKDGDAEFLKLETEGHHFPETYENRTPTGGWHLVYRCDRPVKQGANTLAPGIDIRSKGGYIVGPGSTVEHGDYDGGGEVQDAPAWLVDRCGQPRERVDAGPDLPAAPSGVERAKHYLLNEAPLAVEGEGGDATTFKVAAKCKDFGLSMAEAVCVMLSHWNDRCSPPWDVNDLDTKVANAYKYGLDPVGVAAPEAAFEPVAPAPVSANAEKSTEGLHPFQILNREYAFVVAGGGSHILHETKDAYNRAEVKHLDMATFHAKFAAWDMQCGKKSAQVTKLWMCSPERRSYDGIVFDPQRDHDVVTDERRYFNLWRGFAYKPLPADETPTKEAQHAVDSFFEHALANVCRGDDKLYGWLIGYFAHIVQRPWEKPLVALVFRGGKGVGKNALVERVGALLGGHFLVTSNRRYLTGNFNGHLENCLLFALDEAFWSGDKAAEGQIKDLITGADHVIEHKNKEPFRVANRTRVVIIGNEDWLVPSSHDERRFAVFDVGDGRKQDRGYFERMRTGMENGGYNLLLRQLRAYPVSDVNEAPKTQALHDQKNKSLDPFGKWWLDCLTEGRIVSGDFEGWPGQAECDRFRNAYRRHARDSGQGRYLLSDTEVGKALKKICPAAHGSKKREGVNFLNTYKLPELVDARAAWCEYIGHEVEWPSEVAE